MLKSKCSFLCRKLGKEIKMSRSINRKINLSSIPIKNNQYDWKNSIGCVVDFEYNNIIGSFKIVNHKVNKRVYLDILYNDSIYTLVADSIIKCKLQNVLYDNIGSFKFKPNEVFEKNNESYLILQRYSVKRGNKKYKTTERRYNFKCLECGRSYDRSEYYLINSFKCRHKDTHLNNKEINSDNLITNKAPWMIQYFQGGYSEAKLYTIGSTVEKYFICPTCKRIKDNLIEVRTLYKNQSIGCSCSDSVSYPEKFMFRFFELLDINFHYQLSKKNISWCDDFRYDFYIDKNKTIIETHGLQHYSKKNQFNISLLDIQKNDIAKERLAKDSGIKNYIVLDCRKSELEWIKKSVMESKLPTLFDFKEDDIDWLECEKYALKNLVKEVCEYRNRHPNETIVSISQVFKMKYETIANYLKIGNSLGLCTYVPKKTKYKTICNDNGIIFDSFADCIRRSEKIFGFKINYSQLRDACYNKKLIHGYRFSFVD